MADVKISQLPAATTPLSGTEVVALVQSGTTKKAAINALAPVAATIAALRGISPTNSSSITVLGYYSAGDGAGGEFYSVTGAVGAYIDNGGTIIVPTGGDGSLAWLRIYDGAVNVKWFGARGNGTDNDYTAFYNADAVVGTGGQINVPKGTYYINTALTLTSVLNFDAKAIIKPGFEIIVNLNRPPVAGIYQIFDRSGGGAVQFAGASTTLEVYAEWWGAQANVGATTGKTDNNIYIQYALDALQSVITTDFTTPAPNGDGDGGIVRLGVANEYLCSGPIKMRQRVQLIGLGRYAELKADASWNATQDTFINCANGTSSQFWVRLQDLTINANNNSAITTVIYAPAWQEACGLDRVLIQNFKKLGVWIEMGYGGAVGVQLSSVQFFPSDTNDSSSLFCDMTNFLVGVYNLVLDEISFAGGGSTVAPPGLNRVGLRLKGRVRAQVRGIHIEQYDTGVYLETDASLYGLVGSSGNTSVTSLIDCASSWTGALDCPRVNQGGSTYVLTSNVAGATLLYKAYPPIFERLKYPNDPTVPYAYAQNTANGGTLASTAFGFSSISRTGAGAYTLTFDTSKISTAYIGGTQYTVVVNCYGSNGRTWAIAGKTNTNVSLQFYDMGGSAADCDGFDVYIFGRPGY